METVADWVKAEEEIERKSRGNVPLDRRLAKDDVPEEADHSEKASAAASG